uniref:Scalloped/TEF1 protein n=1 Tax=Phallusia mammillata TaxID=59560 RepID=A0A6F9DV85_9ASCI|nr:scalloped/TEF1 protein [Phallusia mammillata]
MGGPGSNSDGPSPSAEDPNGQKGEVGDNEAEGVWSPDIEQSFHEALAIYPPCGRRKIILSDEGKMYGRNELIARYIKLRTGKTRTRKQVSSHIQVLARRKSREMQSQFKYLPQDQATKDKVLQSMASMSSAQIVSAGVLQNNHMDINQGIRQTYPKPSLWSGLVGQPDPDIKPFNNPPFALPGQSGLGGAMQAANLNAVASRTVPAVPATSAGFNQNANVGPPWENRQIASQKLRLIDFSAFLEQQTSEMDNYSKHLFVHINQSNPSYNDPMLESVDIRQIYDKFPESKGGLRDLFENGPKDSFFLVKFWADLNVNITDDAAGFYAVTSQYESAENMSITCSTKVCSFGKQVVEKVETEYARLENDHYTYRIHRSPMCEYMINFILKLKHLPEKYMMNSVLENFTILQVISNRDTQETLLCLAFVFEVSTSEHGAQHHMYKLVND